MVGEGDGGLLTFGAAAREAINQWGAGLSENVRRSIKSGFERNGPAGDLRSRRMTGFLGEEPRLGETAGAFGARDAPAVHGNAQVVTDAAADGASDVFNDMGHFAASPCVA